MSKLSESPFLTGSFFAALLLLGLSGSPAAAQPAPGSPEAGSAEVDSAEVTNELLRQLEDRYVVLTLTDSTVIQPKSGVEDAGFTAIEIRVGEVVIDGEQVSQSELAERIGDDADLVFGLSQLEDEGSDSSELRRRIEELADTRKRRSEEIEELIRSRVEEIKSLEQEQQEVLEEARLEEEVDPPRRRRRGQIRTDTRVSFGSSLTIEENEISQDVVVLGGSLDVEGKVEGDAVIVGGSAEVQGEVSGSVTAVGGSIFLGPEAKIYGDAVSIGGAIHREGSAEIYGEITEVSLGPGIELDDLWQGIWVPEWHFGWFDFGVGGLIERLGKAVLLAIILLLLVLLWPRFLEGVADRIEMEPWKAGLVGLGAQLLFLFALPVVCFILVITIVGIPLALLLVPLATLSLMVLFYLGYAGFAIAGGRLLQRRFSWREASPYALVLMGLILIQGWSILGEGLGFLGDILDFVGAPIRLVGWVMLLFGFVVKYIAWTTGLGGVLLQVISPRKALTGTYTAPLPPLPPPPAQWEDTAFETESEVSGARLGRSTTLGELREQADGIASAATEDVDDPDEEYLEAGDGKKPAGDEDDGSQPGKSKK